MMADFRANPPKSLVGSKVIRMDDYKSLMTKDLKTGEEKAISAGKLGIEASNVLQFFTADGTKFTCRPSGTEPKIKFYVGVRAKLKNKSEFDATLASLKDKVKAIQVELDLV
jgi:phosphoglucomutase